MKITAAVVEAPGAVPIDRMMSFYDFADIEAVAADAAAGSTVKPVLRM